MSSNSVNGEPEDECYRAFEALHAAALHSSGLPPRYWRSLWRKVTGEIYDAGEVFSIMHYQKGDDDDEEEEGKSCAAVSSRVVVTRDSGLLASDEDAVFLVDHAWTYRVDRAREQLEEVPGLLHRMASLVGVGFHGEVPDPDTMEAVMDSLWKYNQTYQLSQGSAEEKVPVWYVLDEFGSQVQHSDRPSCAMAPFFHVPSLLAYTVLWPLRDLQTGDEVTRDYAYGETDPLVRRCRLLPWIPDELEGVSSSTAEPPDEYYEAIVRENKEELPTGILESPVTKETALKVYSELSQVSSNLSHCGFTLTEDQQEADIIWAYRHIKDYRWFSEQRPHVLLNQFPCESIVTVKDCLSAVSRRLNGGTGPDWLPQTFNLQTELPQFIQHYRAREQRGEDNHWICKPWNLARGLDTHITNNLDYIIRQRESTPKVVCKYLEDPVLFHREDVGLVKFDIRYMLMLRSVQPLRLYAYDVFWLRFANKPFSLDSFDDYQKHFTVMNYTDGVELKQVHYDDFIPMFEEQFPLHPWKEVQAEVFKAFKELFQAATARPAPYGICAYPASRAIYAVDLMLKWSKAPNGSSFMLPQILELNFSPDCSRACLYHPDFYNHMFQTLFLDQPEGCPVTPVA